MSLQEKHVNFLETYAKDDEANEDTKESAKSDANPTSDIIQNENARDEDAQRAEPQETEELLAKGSVPRSLYWKYFRSGASIIMMISFFLCLILGQIGSSGCDYWVGYW